MRVGAAPWLLLTLVLLCLIPRALMALKVTAICPDGVLYIRLAQALNEGDLQGAFSEMRLNTFPVVLVMLHRMGLTWELAGELWGVVISSLVVLPLFGWARRTFDDRVALMACLLYAFHANLIEWSPELIRGPTFWFLFVSSLYLLWRAVTEVRLGFFVAAGAAVILATTTRVEGLFLLIPLVWWSVVRWRALTQGRGRLVVGALLCVAMGPALLLLINATWLQDHSQWEFWRLRPLGLVRTWFESAVASTPAGIERMSSVEMLWVFLHTMTRGLTPVFAVLMFLGVWRWRRVWARHDTLPLCIVAVAVVGGIWIHLWCAQVSSYRYPLPLVLMGSVFAALALLGLSAGALRTAERRGWRPGLRTVAAVLPTICVASIGLADALTSDQEIQAGRSRLGRWMVEEFGPAPSLIGPQGLGTTVGYYAGGQFLWFENNVGDEKLVELASSFRPDVILLTPRQLEDEHRSALTERVREMGFVQVDDRRLPPGPEEVVVFAHHRTVTRAKLHAAAATARARQRSFHQ